MYFQMQSNPLPTYTPANPFEARHLSHSSPMSLNFHSNKCNMALLPGTALGDFWQESLPHKARHMISSSSIFQDVVPTDWKDFSFYTPLIQGRVQSCKIDRVTCVLATIAHHILY